MKVAVIYQSRGGNTKAVAEAIARAAGVTAKPVGAALDEPVDILFIGGGVYKWGLDAELTAFLGTLSPQNVKKIAPFTTAGGMNKTKDIAAIAEGRGIAVTSERLAAMFGLKNHIALGGGKAPVTLSDKHAAAARDFAKKVLEGTI